MSVVVNFSGRYKALTGVDSMVVESSEGLTVEDVVLEVVFMFSSLRVDKSRVMVFRDGVNLSYNQRVIDGDVLVFAPPLVSGG